jgi:phosphoglycerate dehydrogenase-like enzyme
LINGRRLALLPPHALLVNVGRGNAIDENKLIAALKNGTLAGAALDVFKHEPLPPYSEFFTLPNVLVTPHIGGDRPDYHSCAFKIFVENLRRYTNEKPLQNVVEKERGY